MYLWAQSGELMATASQIVDRPGRTMIVAIDDVDDPRLEPYRRVRERDLVGRDGLFIAEGRVVLEKLIAAHPERLASVLVARHRVDSLMPLLAELPPGTPVYSATQAAMDQVVGFPIHRGMLALGRRLAQQRHQRPTRQADDIAARLDD
eukprot:gene53576-73257_t